MSATYNDYRCNGCGVNYVVPVEFRPVHFSGSLSHLSRGYCSTNCARVALNRLLIERAKLCIS